MRHGKGMNESKDERTRESTNPINAGAAARIEIVPLHERWFQFI
jgi:hypothetical protein